MYPVRIVLIVLVAAAIAVAGCTQRPGQKETIGTRVGAAAGGLAGAQFGKGRGKLVTTTIGTLIGSLAGREIGISLDRADQVAIDRTTQESLESAPAGEATVWKNPDSGNEGTVTPQRTYQRDDGTYCREFTQTIRVGGRTEEGYGTACRQPDGTWKIVST